MEQDTNGELLEKLAELDSLPADASDALSSAPRATDTKDKVSMGGAVLDATVAGSKVLEAPAIEKHQRIFQQGVREYRAGEYKLAVTSFTQAIAATPGGLSKRMGGQYAIWLAQALQAQGRKKEAVSLLKRVEAHPDGDVRKVADNVLYVLQVREETKERVSHAWSSPPFPLSELATPNSPPTVHPRSTHSPPQAPELEHAEGTFIKIDMDAVVPQGRGGRRVVEEKDKPPEKYSIEWYQLEYARRQAMGEAETKTEEGGPALVAMAAVVSGTVGLLIADGLGAI